MDSNNLIEQLLNYISPEESIRIENRMLLAAKIDDALKAKGWKKKDLMEALGKKNQSEVTKWLSGTHNFTSDLLTDLGRVLNTNFFNLENDQKTTNVSYKSTQPIVVLYSKNLLSNLNNILESPTTYYRTLEHMHN
jgi:transcriptional regulator with XRE-family HTH domain